MMEHSTILCYTSLLVLIILKGAAFLVDHGANVNAINCCGRTALMLSAMYSDINLLQYLIDKGSNVNHQDKFGHTTMILASKRSRDEDDKDLTMILELLLKAGANPKLKDQFGKTIIHYAFQGAVLSISQIVSILDIFNDDLHYSCDGIVSYAGTPIEINTTLRTFSKFFLLELKLPQPRFIAHILYCMLTNTEMFSSLFQFILNFVKENGILYSYPRPNPVYGNRREIASLEEFAIISAKENWPTERLYQRLIISERVFGPYSLESLTHLKRIIFDPRPEDIECNESSEIICNVEEAFEKHKCTDSQSHKILTMSTCNFNHMDSTEQQNLAELMHVWLNKLENILENNTCTLENVSFSSNLSKILSTLQLFRYDSMIKILSKIAKLVKFIFDKKLYMQHSHRHLIVRGFRRRRLRRCVPQSMLNANSSPTSVDSSSIASDIANFVCELIESGIVLTADISCLRSLITSCEVHRKECRSRFEVMYESSNILFAFLLELYVMIINESDIEKSKIILNLCSQNILNLPIPGRTTLLHFAVQDRSEILVHFLLDNGAHPDAVDSNGITPKEMAISKNSTIQSIFGPDRLSCIACRMIIKESLPYKKLNLVKAINRQIMFHDKNRFVSEYSIIP